MNPTRKYRISDNKPGHDFICICPSNNFENTPLNNQSYPAKTKKTIEKKNNPIQIKIIAIQLFSSITAIQKQIDVIASDAGNSMLKILQ
jgi:hypothetical protein